MRSNEEVVKSNYGYISDAYFVIWSCRSTQSGHIVVANDGSRTARQIQESLDSFGSAFAFAVPVHNRWHEGKTGPFQCLPISRKSLGVGLVAKAISQVRDPPVAKLNEVIRYF